MMTRLRTIQRILTVDMSPEAIDLRMRDLAQLYKLGVSISRSQRLDIHPQGKGGMREEMQGKRIKDKG